MIEVTRLDNSKMFVNAELIRSLQATPDTVITFASNDKMMVKEPVEEVSRRIFQYQRSIHNSDPVLYHEYNQPALVRTAPERYQQPARPQQTIDEIPEILR